MAFSEDVSWYKDYFNGTIQSNGIVSSKNFHLMISRTTTNLSKSPGVKLTISHYVIKPASHLA